MELPDDVAAQLDSFECAVSGMEAALKPLLGMQLKDINHQCEPLQRARVYLTIAHAANALFGAYARTRNVDVSKTAANKESERIRQFARKVGKLTHERELYSAAQRPATVDMAAANRFIVAAIPDLTPEQKRALKSATTRVQQGEASQPPQPQQQPPLQQGHGGDNGGTAKQVKQSTTNRDHALAFLQDAFATVAPASDNAAEQAQHSAQHVDDVSNPAQHAEEHSTVQPQPASSSQPSDGDSTAKRSPADTATVAHAMAVDGGTDTAQHVGTTPSSKRSKRKTAAAHAKGKKSARLHHDDN